MRIGHIAIIIGEKDLWGKGVASEALRLAADYGFSALKLNKLTAGSYAVSERSRRLFEKNGFVLEARLERHYFCGGKFVDGYLFGRLADARISTEET